jgi:hypothetical protein
MDYEEKIWHSSCLTLYKPAMKSLIGGNFLTLLAGALQ